MVFAVINNLALNNISLDYKVHLMTNVIINKVVENDLNFINLSKSLVVYEHMQELEFMNLDRVMALRELDNLVDFDRFDKSLTDHDPIDPIDPIDDVTAKKLPRKVRDFYYSLFYLC